MANWSQSHFLQSLGWATLNSFWQMALLWFVYLISSYLFRMSSNRKYQFSVLAIVVGFGWFMISFTYYFQSSSLSTINVFDRVVPESNSLLNIFLLSASVTYLFLLVFPSYKLFKNWQFVQKIKRQGLQKADPGYRLFVQKISAQLGIGKKVFVYLSDLAKSPVTVGYFKPVILLPFAVVNNLSSQQVEAILLHELSHIRRFDYLVNFIISIISTILYFNPFVKQFMKTIEEERENCCDQLVLQYGYDKLGYASALLTLEKLSVHAQVLALGATGKNYLLNRIEKIIGMEKKRRFRKNQLAAMLAALLCIVIFNSVLIIRGKKQTKDSVAYNNFATPLLLSNGDNMDIPKKSSPIEIKKENKWETTAKLTPASQAAVSLTSPPVLFTIPDQEETILTTVASDDVEASLTKEQKDKIKSTVDATKKVLSGLQWKEVDDHFIGDAMSEKEKARAKQEYIRVFEKTINWENVEENLKSKYKDVDWDKVNTNVVTALTTLRLDSLQKVYTNILVKLDKAKADAFVQSKIAQTPLPDLSIEEIKRSTEELRKKVDTIRAIRSPKRIVHL